MMNRQDCLIEIGTEELPPKALKKLSQAFTDLCQQGLEKKGFSAVGLKAFATPRRLAILIEGLQIQTEDQTVERRGPAAKAGFGPDGKPSNALLGFARSCGIEVSQIQVLKTDKGEYCVAHVLEKGLAVKEILTTVVTEALKQLPIPKLMRWGDSDYTFVRPVHWVVLLLGESVISGTIMGIASDRYSYGHRFHHPAAIAIPTPKAYPELLRAVGNVIVDMDERAALVHSLSKQVVLQTGGEVHCNPHLLEEVAAIVEWPYPLLCQFNPDFLKVPHQALISAMQGHQKCFPVVDSEGHCLPYFVAVSNIKSLDQKIVIAGNERVMRARLADAAFFFEQDCEKGLEVCVQSLTNVNFHRKLGSMKDKVDRLVELSTHIAPMLGAEVSFAVRAAYLCKADLMTNMVGEFPELQGVMGHYYAVHQGEAEAVCEAMSQHYWPRFSGDHLPKTKTGVVVAIADRLDNLIALFSVGEKPTGDKDPFGLRRAAIGLIRILAEDHIDLDCRVLLTQAAASLSSFAGELVIDEVLQFCFERLRIHYLEQGVSTQIFEAVLGSGVTNLREFGRRVKAVTRFLERPEAMALLAANKRVQNILAKQKVLDCPHIDVGHLALEQEKNLYVQLIQVEEQVELQFKQGHYDEFFVSLASLDKVLESFFEHVMVVVEDEQLKRNRLAILAHVGLLFRHIADLSKIS